MESLAVIPALDQKEIHLKLQPDKKKKKELGNFIHTLNTFFRRLPGFELESLVCGVDREIPILSTGNPNTSSF